MWRNQPLQPEQGQWTKVVELREGQEIAVDTTDDQLIYYGGAKRVILTRSTKP